MTLRHNTIRSCICLLLAASAAAPVLAQNHGVQATGLLPVPANRLVGHWQGEVELGACTGGPAFVKFKAFSTFHAGGTLSDTNSTPSALRSPGQGTWRYRGAGRYESRFQIFRFLPTGMYDGLADIRTTIDLDASAQNTVSRVEATNYNPDGTFRGKLCGVAVGERVSID